ncbi:unnamed protein product [Leptidea sinapis]|uniref:Endonuclease/exonuclease/phosphatase domain-containing protein n=1 Tax=Leptidea sinapis TaxID=189913 RepID=A0A5E4QLF8_9NEOP|nr:unnamed protein product [Leptidea sinapis]
MPVDCLDNLPEYTDVLASMYSIVEDSGLEVSYVLGDFNSHPGTRFADEMLSFCMEQQLLCADMEFLRSNSDTFTFMSDAHGSRRWLDHCLTTYAAWDTVTKVQVDYNSTNKRSFIGD